MLHAIRVNKKKSFLVLNIAILCTTVLILLCAQNIAILNRIIFFTPTTTMHYAPLRMCSKQVGIISDEMLIITVIFHVEDKLSFCVR